MEIKELDAITGMIVEMRVIAEGAISLYEKNPKPEDDAYNLVGEALYMLQERINCCLPAFQNKSKGYE